MSSPRLRKKRPRYSLTDLFQVLGEVTVTWAFLDSLIDDCIQDIHKNWGGKTIIKEVPNISLERKMAYLRKWHAEGPRISEIFPTLLDIVDALESAVEHRHRLIHGILLPLEFTKTGKISFYRERVRKKGGQPESVTFTLKSVREFRDWAYRLAIFFGAFAEILTGDPVSKNKPDKSFRAMFIEMDGFLPLMKGRRNVRKKGR